MFRTEQLSPSLWIKDIQSILNSYRWELRRKAKKQLGCCCYHQMPPAAREPYIESGYRPIGMTIRQSALSAFTLHNETVNFWTHLLAALYFVQVLRTDMLEVWDSPDQFTHLLPCFAFAFSLFTCFSLSAVAHLFCSVSVEGKKSLFVLDYAGVGANALGAAICYCAYIPEDYLPLGSRNIYSVLIVFFVSLAAAGCSIAMVYWSDWPAGQLLKAFSFGSIALQGNIPLLIYLSHIKAATEATSAITYHFWCYACFKLLCGFFLSSCIPERFCKLTFDLLGHSHQIFHVFCFLCVRSQYQLGHALSAVHKEDNLDGLWWRSILTLVCGYAGLCLTATIFIKEIYRLKTAKLKL